MRKTMQKCVSEFICGNENSALLLVDIGAWAFRDLLGKYPCRAKNIGIFEQGTVSVAAGLSLSGIVPTIYGISPFISQRSLEQIKLDFVYQKTGGNFITTGASYDFSTLGYSHYCPEEAAVLKMLPGLDVLAPGTPSQFAALWNACHDNGRPSYFRMTDHSNVSDIPVEYGKAAVVKSGKKALVITCAESFDAVRNAAEDLDVTILYYTTIAPFDCETLKNEFVGGKIFVFTPFYNGSLSSDIHAALEGIPCAFYEHSVPLEVIRNYGTKRDKDEYFGFTPEKIREYIVKNLDE